MLFSLTVSLAGSQRMSAGRQMLARYRRWLARWQGVPVI
jgi:hypothetical protein